MKRILLCLSVLLCMFALPVGISAEEALYMLDWADLLTEEEETELNGILAEISVAHSANIVAATVDSLEGADAQDYADNLYDTGLGYFGLQDGTEDGVLFLLAMDERQWAVTTTGFGITAITERALDQMEAYIIPLLSQGNYCEAFLQYAELTDAWFALAENGGMTPEADYIDPYYPGAAVRYESHGSPEITVRTFGAEWILIALVIGFLIALIPMGVLKSQLNTVHMQTGAVPYQKTDGVRITDSRDLYLYRNMTKKPIPRNDPPKSGGTRLGGSIHTGPSGRPHGGRSGGF